MEEFQIFLSLYLLLFIMFGFTLASVCGFLQYKLHTIALYKPLFFLFIIGCTLFLFIKNWFLLTIFSAVILFALLGISIGKYVKNINQKAEEELKNK